MMGNLIEVKFQGTLNILGQILFYLLNTCRDFDAYALSYFNLLKSLKKMLMCLLL